MPPWLAWPYWWFEHLESLRKFLAGAPFDWWLLARWAVQNLLLSGSILLADLLAGAALLKMATRGRYLPPALRAAGALAAGSGMAGTGIFLLGVAGLISRTAALALTCAMGLAGVLILQRLRAWRWTFCWVRSMRTGRGGAVVLVLLLPVLVLHVADLLMPVLEFDARMYHMTAAKYYRDSGGLPYLPAVRYNAHPHLPVLLLLRGWLLAGDDALGKLVNLEYAAMIVLVMVYAARELRWKDAWVAGVLFIAASPVFCWTAKSEYADLPQSAYVTVAGACLFHGLRRRSEAAVIPAGLALGFAGASKLHGLVMAACAVAAFSATAAGLWGWKRTARLVVVLGLLTAAPGVGWWTRSWVHTKSPVAPFFLRDHSEVDAHFQVNYGYGRGHDWKAFLMLPWRMVAEPPPTFADLYSFGPQGLLLACAGLLMLVTARWRPPREVLFLLLLCFAFTLFWFRTGQVMRYLASLLPLAAILFLMAMKRFRATRLAALPLLAILGLPGPVVSSSVIRQELPPPVTYDQKDRTIASVLPELFALRALNREAKAGDRVYLLFCEDYRYYLDPPASGDWFGPYNYRWLSQGLTAPEDFVERVRRLGFRFVSTDLTRVARHGGVFQLPFGDFRLPGARVVYHDGRYVVLELLKP